MIISGVATGRSRGGGGRVPKFAKNREKEVNQEKLGEKMENSGRKGKNQEGSFTLPLLDR